MLVPQEHPSMQGALAQKFARDPQYDLVDIIGVKIGHGLDKLGRILIVRVEHDHDISPNSSMALAGITPSGLLVAPRTPGSSCRIT